MVTVAVQWVIGGGAVPGGVPRVGCRVRTVPSTHYPGYLPTTYHYPVHHYPVHHTTPCTPTRLLQRRKSPKRCQTGSSIIDCRRTIGDTKPGINDCGNTKPGINDCGDTKPVINPGFIDQTRLLTTGRKTNPFIDTGLENRPVY